MTYISQLIVYALAVMAVLFKSTETGADGKPIYWRHNVPKLTRTGVIVLSLITLSSVTAMYSAHTKSAAEKEAKEKQQKAEYTLNDVQQQNKALREVLGQVYQQGQFISEDQRKQFASVLTEQKQTGENIASNIQGSANLLRGRVDNSINLLQQSAYQIKRAANPIRDVQISFEISPPKDSVEIANYQSRLEQGIRSIDLNNLPRGIFVSRRVEGGKVLWLGIAPDSQLFPDSQYDGVVSTVLRNVGITIEFYKPAAQIDRLRRGFGRHPDFSVSIKCNTANLTPLPPEARRATLAYDLEKQRITVTSDKAISDPNTWEGTENITSLPDLLNSQMVVRVGPYVLSTDPTIREAQRKVLGQFQVNNIALKISGRDFQFAKFTRYEDFNDHYFFVCDFSSNQRLYER